MKTFSSWKNISYYFMFYNISKVINSDIENLLQRMHTVVQTYIALYNVIPKKISCYIQWNLQVDKGICATENFIETQW